MGFERLLELLERVRRAADEVLPPLPVPVPLPKVKAATAAAAAVAKASSIVSAAAAAATPRPTSFKHDSQNDGIVSIALKAGVFGFRRRSSSRSREEKEEEEEEAAAAAAAGERRRVGGDSVAVVELGAGRGYLGAAAADALVRLDDGEEGQGYALLPLRCSSLTLVDKRVSFFFFSFFLFFLFFLFLFFLFFEVEKEDERTHFPSPSLAFKNQSGLPQQGREALPQRHLRRALCAVEGDGRFGRRLALFLACCRLDFLCFLCFL